MWELALDYFKDNQLITHCLTSLKKFSKEKRWKNYKIEDNLSIINSIGIGASFFYGHACVEAHIVDFNNDHYIDRRSKEWKKLKKEGLIRLYIEINNLAEAPKYPIHILDRLLKVIKKDFAHFKIIGNTIQLVQTNEGDRVAELFLRLCDILFSERVKCHYDIKKYYYGIGFLKRKC